KLLLAECGAIKVVVRHASPHLLQRSQASVKRAHSNMSIGSTLVAKMRPIHGGIWRSIVEKASGDAMRAIVWNSEEAAL
ncbi:MAG: hypothetical protein ACLGIM_13820, partial [Alphaproteobacteria bacterium]